MRVMYSLTVLEATSLKLVSLGQNQDVSKTIREEALTEKTTPFFFQLW